MRMRNQNSTEIYNSRDIFVKEYVLSVKTVNALVTICNRIVIVKHHVPLFRTISPITLTVMPTTATSGNI